MLFAWAHVPTLPDYNHAQYLEERRQMIQAWGDYIDSLAAGVNVTPIRKHVA